MSVSVDPAALWALTGGTVYAGTRLSTALWGGSEIGRRARRLAIAQFVLALILAPAAGVAITPHVMDALPGSTVASASFVIGLFANAVWPLLVEPNFLRQLVRDMARGLADRLSAGDPK